MQMIMSESVKHDILISMSKLKKDGIISGHDYNLYGVSKAVNELFLNIKIITFSDKSWAVI